MDIKTKNGIKVAFRVLCIILGTFIMGCAYNLFYASQNIVLGGFGGLSILISNWLSNIGVVLDMYIIYFALNMIVFVFAAKLLGKTFAFYTLLGVTGYTVFLKVTTFVNSISVPSSDLLLCCIYGGVLTGVGVGLVVRMGGSTGGGDLLGCIANHFSRRLTVGNVSMVINLAVILLSVLTFGLELALYGIIAIYFSGMITDVVVEGPKSVKAYYIISKKYVEISNAVMNELGRGVTAFYAEGMYTGNDQRVLLCIVYKHQITKLRNIVYKIDNKAFVYSVAVNDAMGKGFSTLKPAENLLQKIALKNTKKAIPSQNYIGETTQTFTPKPSNDGINIFEGGLKDDLNETTNKKSKTNAKKSKNKAKSSEKTKIKKLKND